MDQIQLLRYFLFSFVRLMILQSCEFTMMMIMQRETLFSNSLLHPPFSFERRYQNSVVLCRDVNMTLLDLANGLQMRKCKIANCERRSRGKALLVFSLRWLCNLSLIVKAKDDVRWGLSSHCYRF